VPRSVGIESSGLTTAPEHLRSHHRNLVRRDWKARLTLECLQPSSTHAGPARRPCSRREKSLLSTNEGGRYPSFYRSLGRAGCALNPALSSQLKLDRARIAHGCWHSYLLTLSGIPRASPRRRHAGRLYDARRSRGDRRAEETLVTQRRNRPAGLRPAPDPRPGRLEV
jgi:hypothetical protein